MIPLDYFEIVETEFVYHRDGKPLFSGTPDRVRIYPTRGLAICSDYKFGFKVVQSVDANMQLRAYLAMISEEYPVANYYGAIFQPRVSAKPNIVRYSHADVLKARAEIEAVWDACFAKEPPRHASNEACEWCEAKTICPEHKAWIGEIEKVRHLPVAQWTDEQMNLFETRRSAALKFIEEAHEQIKLIKATDPDRLPGWNLKPGASVRTVSDLVAAWGSLQSHMSAREFSEACDVSIGALERILWQRSQGDIVRGKLSQKQAKALLNDLLKGLIELKRNKPSLEKE